MIQTVWLEILRGCNVISYFNDSRLTLTAGNGYGCHQQHNADQKFIHDYLGDDCEGLKLLFTEKKAVNFERSVLT